MLYNIEMGMWGSVIAIPTDIIDKYLKTAGEKELKVILWLLRNNNKKWAPEEISASLDMSLFDVDSSLKFWIEQGIISIDNSSLSSSNINQTSFTTLAQSPSLAEKESKVVTHSAGTKERAVVAKPIKPTQKECNERIASSDEVAFLVRTSQELFGKLLTHGEISTLIYLHDYVGLPTDVILMCIEYAKTHDKGNMSYIEKVAVEWSNEDINTHEKAEKKINTLNRSIKNWYAICAIMGIDERMPSQKEADFVSCWIEEYRFNKKMIKLAYDQCVNNTGKISFPYINKVLEKWFKAKVRTEQDYINYCNKRKEKLDNKDQKNTSFNLDEYENMTADKVPTFNER